MKKLQATAIVGVLLVVVYGVNVLTEQRQKAAQQQAKQVEQERRSAEAAAADKTSPKHPGGSAAAFILPGNSGPKTAPVKLEIFINNGNSCQQSSVNQMRDLQKAYGSLVRVEWCGTTDPKLAARADKLQIGCESGLVIDGKIEHQIRRNGGKVLLSFRGPAGEKYKLEDLYMVLNQELAKKGLKAPPTAVLRARATSAATPRP